MATALMVLGVIYIMVAWAVAGWVLFYSPMSGEEQLEIPFLGAVLAIGISPLIGPPILLYAVGWAIREVWHERQWLKSHHEPDLSKASPFDMPAGCLDELDRSNPQMFSLGYTIAGDFWYRIEPWKSVARVFVSPNGGVLLTVLWMEENTGHSAVSLLADGVVVETTDQTIPSEPPTHGIDRVHWRSAEGADLATLVQRHLVEIAELGGDVFSFTPDQVPQVLLYSSRSASQWKHRTGQIREPPPDPTLPTAPVITVTADAGASS